MKPLSYEEARDRFPGATASCVAQLRRSRSKYRNSPPESFLWSLHWATQGWALSFADVLSATQGHPKPVDTRTTAERTSAWIALQSKGWCWTEPLPELPPEVLAWCEARDQKTTPTMTAKEALQGLIGTPGFTAIITATQKPKE